MDLNKLVESLSDVELNELSSFCYQERHNRAERKVKNFPEPGMNILNLAKTNRVEAIRLYRDTYKCDLMMAKIVVDFYNK